MKEELGNGDKSAKWDQNVVGKFYVDDQCIACDACVMEAEKFFEMNDDDGHAYVKAQPTTEEDQKFAKKLLRHAQSGHRR